MSFIINLGLLSLILQIHNRVYYCILNEFLMYHFFFFFFFFFFLHTGSTQPVTSKGSIIQSSKTTHTTPLFTATVYSITTPVVNSVSTPVLNSSPLALNSTQTPVTNSTPTPVVSTTTPFPVTNSQHVCRDHALCSDPHMKLTACNDLYLSKTFCPKLCHLCGEYDRTSSLKNCTQ